MKVIDFGQCRSLLQIWEEVRRLITSRGIRGFAITIMDGNGQECIHLAGRYKEDPEAARRAGLRMSWTIAKNADKAEATGT